MKKYVVKGFFGLGETLAEFDTKEEAERYCKENADIDDTMLCNVYDEEGNSLWEF